jgi:hypothetical protein
LFVVIFVIHSQSHFVVAGLLSPVFYRYVFAPALVFFSTMKGLVCNGLWFGRGQVDVGGLKGLGLLAC